MKFGPPIARRSELSVTERYEGGITLDWQAFFRSPDVNTPPQNIGRRLEPLGMPLCAHFVLFAVESILFVSIVPGLRRIVHVQHITHGFDDCD